MPTFAAPANEIFTVTRRIDGQLTLTYLDAFCIGCASYIPGTSRNADRFVEATELSDRILAKLPFVGPAA